jgi:hypothetical protein
LKADHSDLDGHCIQREAKMRCWGTTISWISICAGNNQNPSEAGRRVMIGNSNGLSRLTPIAAGFWAESGTQERWKCDEGW